MNDNEITFTPQQLFAIIDLPCKPYAGIMQPSTYFSIRKRYANGTVKEKTLDKFFKAFGFEGAEKKYRAIALQLSETVVPDEV